jgi:cytochrome c oxidase subunit IV
MAAHAPTQTEEHGHPGARQYITIALILASITALEVTVYYIDALRPVLPPLLIALSAVKFALVVMYYMHLKFDHPIFTGMFIFGLATAIFTFVGFLALFGFVSIFH